MHSLVVSALAVIGLTSFQRFVSLGCCVCSEAALVSSRVINLKARNSSSLCHTPDEDNLVARSVGTVALFTGAEGITPM